MSNISRSLWITSPGSKSPQGEAMDGQGCDIFVGNLGHFSIRKPIWNCQQTWCFICFTNSLFVSSFCLINAFKLPTLKFEETKNLESDPGHSSPCLLRRHWNNQGKSSEKAWHHVASASKIIKHIFGCDSSTSYRTLWQLLAILVLSAGGNVYRASKGQTCQKKIISYKYKSRDKNSWA